MKLIAFVAALALAGPVLASPRENLVVQPAWLAQHLTDPNLVILQVGDKASYDAGHIPGAQLVNLAQVAAAPSGPDSLTLEMLDAPTLHDRLAAMGITDKSKIVVYYGTDGIQSATRMVMTLKAAGLGDRTVLLDGGINGWKRDNRATTTEVAAPKPGKLAALKMKPVFVDSEFVRTHLNAPGYAIVDARAPAFYSGQMTGGGQAKPHKTGHIAGAKSVPFNSLTSGDLKLNDAQDLSAKFKAAGVKPGDTVVAYCHVGQQATAVAFAAQTLGIKVLVYDGSFEDWSRKDGPVEK
jgi:thiosulfate/3-mercaptopyruvate sulfurtransferase